MTDAVVDQAQLRPRRRPRRGGNGGVALLLLVLVFQMSILPDTLGIRALGRIANAIALLVFTLGGAYALSNGRALRAPRTYVVAVVLVIIGLSLNILRSLSAESVGSAGALLPFVAALSIPFLDSADLARYWRVFYRFMFWMSCIALVEYAAVFAGVLGLSAIETERGPYLKGILTYFFGLGDGSVHYRLYGVFAEPGTFAMYLIPAIAYAWLHGKRWPIALFLACFFFTDSLGGFLSLVVLGLTYLFWKSARRPVGLLVAMLVLAPAFYAVSGPIRERYEEKGVSREVREKNVEMFRANFLTVVKANPLGMPLTGKSLSELENVTNNYLGSNFEIYTFFVEGGILASFGYTLLLAWMLVVTVRWLLIGDRDIPRATAMLCVPAMLLFVVQRETILASASFAFLMAPALLAAARPGAFMPASAPRAPRRRRRRRPAPVDARQPGV